MSVESERWPGLVLGREVAFRVTDDHETHEPVEGFIAAFVEERDDGIIIALAGTSFTHVAVTRAQLVE